MQSLQGESGVLALWHLSVGLVIPQELHVANNHPWYCRGLDENSAVLKPDSRAEMTEIKDAS